MLKRGDAEGLQFARDRQALWLKNVKGLYGVARDLANAAKEVTDPELREQCEALAVQTLQLAVSAGLRTTKTLRAEPAFAALKQRDDFRKVLDQLPQK